MSRRDTQPSNSSDMFLWGIIIAVLAMGIYANFHFAQVATPIRLMFWLVGSIVLVFIAKQTVQGQRAWGFIKDARNEMIKVVWPSRQETVQTTAIVIVMVIITSLILWAIDSLLLAGVGAFTGHVG